MADEEHEVGRRGRLYSIASLPAHQSSPRRLNTWIRRYGKIENSLHSCRDASQTLTGAAPRVMAAKLGHQPKSAQPQLQHSQVKPLHVRIPHTAAGTHRIHGPVSDFALALPRHPCIITRAARSVPAKSAPCHMIFREAPAHQAPLRIAEASSVKCTAWLSPSNDQESTG